MSGSPSAKATSARSAASIKGPTPIADDQVIAEHGPASAASSTSQTPSDRATDPRHPDRLAGRLEHVLSGRRHDFANGQALLACLAFEQQQLALDATDTADAALC